MNRGFLATLFAAAFSFAGLQAAHSAAPVISNLPDYIRVGDGEAADRPGGSDNNFFIFTNTFQFSASVHDPDTADTALEWSFGEYNGVGVSPAGRYAVNGVAAITQGTAATDALYLAGGPTDAGANQINSGAVGSAGDWATIRDTHFSPGTGIGPFPEPSNQAKTDAALGKNVIFWVTDGEHVTSDTVHITTVDDVLDEASSDVPETVELYGEDTGFLGWEKNGLDDGPEVGGPASDDVVDVTTETGRLIVEVRAATSRTRIMGFRNASIGVYPGADKYIRGKFYIYTSNASTAAVNTVPGFRIRIDNVNAVQAETNVLPANSGNTGPTAPNATANWNGTGQPFNFFTHLANAPILETRQTTDLRPSGNSAKPSLYRVDLDPVDVPAAVGSKIFAVFQSFTTADPSAGFLSMTECTVLTYPALDNADGSQLFVWDRTLGTTAAQDVNAGFAAFNASNDLRDGYRQYIQLGAPYDGTPAASLASFTNDGTGMTVDTGANHPANDIGVALLNIEKGVVNQPTAGAHYPKQLRVLPNKLYKARFYATSDMIAWSNNINTVRQGNLRFRFQVSNYNSYLQFIGPVAYHYNTPAVIAGDPYVLSTGDILRQAIPSTGASNPDNLVNGVNYAAQQSGQGGGWYTIIATSPISDDIRQDKPGTTAQKFPALMAEGGPGAAGESFRSIILGADATKFPMNLLVGNSNSSQTAQFFSNNRAHLRIHRVELHEFDMFDDGGYGY